MPKKILIGIVTSDLKKYCFDKLAEAIKSQTFKDFDVLFVDNSESDYDKVIVSEGFRVIKDSPKDNRINNIISGRNIIRDEFLKGDYKYLFFLDSDVLIPGDTIAKLLSYNNPLMTGIYLVAKHINGKPYPFPCIYKEINEDNTAKPFAFNEVIKDKLIEIVYAGLGCCLIHKDVLKAIKFRNIGTSTTGGEDAAFFIDARKAGFIAYADTSVKCFHMHYPPDDPRHNFHKFETHIRKPEQTHSYSINVEGFEIK